MSATITVDLNGPNFLSAAIAVSHQVGIRTISELRVNLRDGQADLAKLVGVFAHLKVYVAPNGRIALFLPSAGISRSLVSELSKAAGVPVDLATPQAQMERWKALQDTQTKIFEIQQDVTANKARTQDKA